MVCRRGWFVLLQHFLQVAPERAFCLCFAAIPPELIRYSQTMHPNKVAVPLRSSQQQCPTARADAGHWSIVSRMCKNFIFLGATYYTSGMLSSPCASKLRLEGKLWVPSATLTMIRNGSCLELGGSPDAASWEFYQCPDKMG